MPKPRVTAITIENVLGLEKLEVNPGSVTVISGRNGAGKTSFLEAIRSLLRGGSDPSLLRKGADKGVVQIVRADGAVLTKRITAKACPLDVRFPGVGKVSQAQAVVDAMVDELAIDPLAVISAKPKDRPRLLLDLVTIDLPNDVIAEAAGIEIPPVKGTALERLELVRSYVYDRRRDATRTAKDKRATEAELTSTLPPDEGELPDVAALRSERTDLERRMEEAARHYEAVKARAEAGTNLAVQATKTSAEATRSAKVEGIQGNAQAEINGIREDTAQKIRDLEKLRDEAVERVKERARAKAQEAREEADRATRTVEEAARSEAASAIAAAEKAAVDLSAELRPRADALTVEITRAEEREKEHIRAEKTREILARTAKEAGLAEMESAALSQSLERLDALKAAQLEKLPIPGLEARQDDLYFDGIPFERLNTATQIELGVRLAALRAGDSGLVVVDHGEALDADGFAALKASAHAAGVQLIVARVTDGPLTVTTEEQAA